MTTRPARSDDIPRIGTIAGAAGLFPPEMVADMIAPGLAGEGDLWSVIEAQGTTAGFTFSRPEEITDRTWNILALGLDPAFQGQGLGTALLRGTEAALPDARMIIIETTQLPEQDAARALYAAAGYEQQAHIPDFYGDGEDKVVFVKRVGDAA
ncbi:MAG: GNAT family N-acetyltransferase [Pseudomonadota bacterium]